MRIIYARHRERLLTGQFNWLAATVRIALTSAKYSATEADKFLGELAPEAILVRSPVLGDKNAADGFARALPPELIGYYNSVPATGVLLYEDTGDDATSELICYTNDGPGLPLTGIGLNYVLSYNAALGGYYRA